MKRLAILVFMALSLIAAVSNAEDFTYTLLSNNPSPLYKAQNFWDFSTWFAVSVLCTGSGVLMGLLADTEENSRGFIVGGSIGLGTALTASLLSSAGLNTSDVIFFRVVPVLLGAPAGVILLPVVAITYFCLLALQQR